MVIADCGDSKADDVHVAIAKGRSGSNITGVNGANSRIGEVLSRPGRGVVTAWRRVTPVQTFVASFALLIVLGTLGLRLLPGLYVGERLGWVDSLFTATSAVCVTGLIVVDTATYFTRAGQAFLLLLIQLGGLGMLAFTTMIILSLGRRLSLRQEALAVSLTEVAPHIDSRRLTRHVLRFTLMLEAVGAILLFASFAPRFGMVDGAWHAVFQAISAFCNAGFSTFSDSLAGFQESAAPLVVVMVLIVLGGLGFLTIEELYLQRRARRRGERPERLSLHSRLVLAVTGLLLIVPWALFSLFEWGVTLAELPVWAKLINGLFASVTARTAGFNTIDHMAATDSTNFLTIILMFIGGSPGSAAGGIKTTTVGLIGLLAWSRLRGRQIASVGGRSIREETLQRAVGLIAIAFVVITAAIMIYVSLEFSGTTHAAPGSSFLAYMFEATSAFNTVGLSMGVTDGLSTGARWLTIVLMYVGRVGPLSVAASLVLPEASAPRKLRYSYEDVVVG